jgi:D-lactate dehydrogenase
MSTIAVFDAKPYDVAYLKAACAGRHTLVFHEFRLLPETASLAKGAEVVCLFVNDRADRACLGVLRAAGVRHLALRCAGFNNVDLSAARELGLSVSRVPAYSPHAVAEHAIALLLTLNRKIHRAHNRVRELNFSLNGLVGFDLHGKTAGILGTGKIGRITAEILRGFGVQVLAYDPYRDDAWAAAKGVRYASMEEIFPQADILSLHTPLTPETHHLVNARSLALMKPGVVLINTSRGKLIDTAALIQALKSQHLGGVALDVYEEEAGIFYEDLSGQILADDELSRLLTFPNVLITSHQAFLTREALTQIAQVTLDNAARIAEGRPLLEGTQLV